MAADWRLSPMLFFITYNMYRLWSRKAGDRHWLEMPYNPDTLTACEHRLAYYEENWGNFYSYRIEPSYVCLNQQAAWA